MGIEIDTDAYAKVFLEKLPRIPIKTSIERSLFDIWQVLNETDKPDFIESLIDFFDHEQIHVIAGENNPSLKGFVLLNDSMIGKNTANALSQRYNATILCTDSAVSVGLVLLRAFQPDFLITGGMFKGFADSMQAPITMLHYLKKLNQPIPPTVFMSAVNYQSVIRRAQHLGVKGYLIIPEFGTDIGGVVDTCFRSPEFLVFGTVQSD